MKKIDAVYQVLVQLNDKGIKSISAEDLVGYLELNRSSISRYLNELYRNGKVLKSKSRPVLYSLNEKECNSPITKKESEISGFDVIAGSDLSLRVAIQQAKAAILYPPRGLHTLILGETGVGKSMFAELMHDFAKESNVIDNKAPFIRFNCADYVDNPQLILSQIFGVKKGAYTGADSDKEGLLKKSHGGILFLDEVHRLPPQGQEMLFTFIDKGCFRPLGETEKMENVETQIIAATTEYPQSSLLRTFVRRIPMIIEIPPLRDRSLIERYNLLIDFIKSESKRLNKSIYLEKNVLISYLLYECPNNIGQLKSDFQLACAKAFLKYKTNVLGYILIEQVDLQRDVKKGLMNVQKYRKEIDEVLKYKGDVLRFHFNEEKFVNNTVVSLDNDEKSEMFYDIIEKRLLELKDQGLEEKEISQILNIDIESYFNKYISKLPKILPKEKLAKVVNKEIAETVYEILNIAEMKLNKRFDEKVYIGLAIHLQVSIERIRNGNKIFNPKLNFIRVRYADEFLVAMELTKILDNRFNIEFPIDEIGYLAMFLAFDLYEQEIEKDSKVGILVMMHGDSTASSMTNVANRLIGEDYAQAIDMPLNVNVDEMYEVAKEKIINMNNGKGVLLLVDMGSLCNFGEMISDETGINIKTIQMASTPVVIEALSKAVLGRKLNSIYKACIQISRYKIEAKPRNNKIRKFLIITTCFTGEGVAETLKKIISENVIKTSSIEIKALNILDRNDFLAHVEKLSKEYKILAVVGTVNIFIENIPFIPAPDILDGSANDKINKLIKTEEIYMKIEDTLKNHIEIIGIESVVDECRLIIKNIEEVLSIMINEEVKSGIILHIAFMIDRIKNGESNKIVEDFREIRNQYNREFIFIKQALKPLEQKYEININDSELSNIVKIIVKNNEA
ncbi:sigma 54-interacting transcriptional regulator [Abyssisolibacter fermentans]|uniref:sigma 54-interacting transcriptional regulator n=1 Tax=Abyssisolibacter fermentans TaxID=1766203 RepID=UPI00082B4AD2|nr:sigma-54-dependent transcriptional regulator [Abyssisolibacter fermentans]